MNRYEKVLRKKLNKAQEELNPLNESASAYEDYGDTIKRLLLKGEVSGLRQALELLKEMN